MNSKTYSDFGVRKYDVAGRFLSIDPLWEKYLAWSPYHYCGNNPVNATDGNGKNAVNLVNVEEITVKAVYVVDTEFYSSKQIEELNKISTFLNNEKYSVSGGEYNGFCVNFDLKFVLDLESNGSMHYPEDYNENEISIGNTFSKRGSGYSDEIVNFSEDANGRGSTIAGSQLTTRILS